MIAKGGTVGERGTHAVKVAKHRVSLQSNEMNFLSLETPASVSDSKFPACMEGRGCPDLL